MPTPIVLLLDPISLGVFLLYAGLMIWERLRPARKLPTVKGWRMRGLLSFALFFFLSSYLPILWDAKLAEYQLLDLSELGTAAGALVGLLVYEGLLYLWHRSLHESGFLFRGFHQVHHSAERVDTFGAFYFSPLDMAGFTFVGSLSLALFVGLSADAITVFLFATLFLGIFQHANIATPRWLGFLIQRPESHALHHARGVHYYNFSDLPIFDMLGGTFKNPRQFPSETGFYHGASNRMVDMLLWRDVTEEDGHKLETSQAV
ncbi:MAG: sterol desaturase family protein [Pseudomonadota bacterium]